MENIAIHKAYLSDVMGTTTPIKHTEELYKFAKESIDDIASEMDANRSELLQTIEAGHNAFLGNNKDHPAFKEYIKIADKASQKGYKSGKLKMNLEDGVEEAVREIEGAGGNFYIFSSGTNEASELGMTGNGLYRYIRGYFTSADKNIGSKAKSEAYVEIARRLGLNPSEMCYITDTDKEAVAAVNAGYGAVFLIDKKQKEGKSKEGYNIVHNFDTYKKMVLRKNNADQKTAVSHAKT